MNGATIYMKDVATVHDGFVPQTNIVRTNGSRGVLLTVTRNGKASTLAIVNAVKDALPKVMATVTQDLKICRCSAISRCSCGRPSAASCARR